MLPNCSWGYDCNYCTACETTRKDHSEDCLTLELETVFAEVVGALRAFVQPCDCYGRAHDRHGEFCRRAQSALSAVEKLSKGE